MKNLKNLFLYVLISSILTVLASCSSENLEAKKSIDEGLKLSAELVEISANYYKKLEEFDRETAGEEDYIVRDKAITMKRVGEEMLATISQKEKALIEAYENAVKLYTEDGSNEKAAIVQSAINVWKNGVDQSTVTLLGTSAIPSIKEKSAIEILKKLN